MAIFLRPAGAGSLTVPRRGETLPWFDGRRGRIFHDSCSRTARRGAPSSCCTLREHLGLYDPLARRLVTDGHAVHNRDAVHDLVAAFVAAAVPARAV